MQQKDNWDTFCGIATIAFSVHVQQGIVGMFLAGSRISFNVRTLNEVFVNL